MKERPHIPARPTVYKGIKMRSRLEADYASALDRDGETWEYEPTCFGGPEGQWLPDFRVGSHSAYVELKPAYLIAWDTRDLNEVYARIDKILTRMTIAWVSEPDVYLHLVFWTYGAEQTDAPLSIAAAGRNGPWLTYTPSTLDVPLMWPGMGQFDAIACQKLHDGEAKS